VDSRVKAALDRDAPNWRVLNSCPACTYEVRVYGVSVAFPHRPFPQLEDEPSLVFRRMYAIDGNDSLKRVARIGSRNIGDSRCFSGSDYYIPSEEIEEWAKVDESQPDELEDGDAGTEDGVEEPGSLEGEDANPGPCANNWKAAQSDSKKHMWGIFDETGLFASACRHGLILWIADMVRSGEQ
jgi:hypothetical protein